MGTVSQVNLGQVTDTTNACEVLASTIESALIGVR